MSNKVRASEYVDLTAMITPLQKICAECDRNNTGECKPAACTLGFALRSLQFAHKKGILDIPGAANHIPKTDLKTYYVDTIVPALVETCRQCRECRDNHSPDCVISLTRTCLESVLLEDAIDYPGSVFLYLALIKKQDQELAEKVASELKKGV